MGSHHGNSCTHHGPLFGGVRVLRCAQHGPGQGQRGGRPRRRTPLHHPRAKPRKPIPAAIARQRRANSRVHQAATMPQQRASAALAVAPAARSPPPRRSRAWRRCRRSGSRCLRFYKQGVRSPYVPIQCIFGSDHHKCVPKPGRAQATETDKYLSSIVCSRLRL